MRDIEPGVSTAPQMLLAEPAETPDDVREGIAAFAQAAAEQPEELLGVLSASGVLLSPERIVAEYKLGDPDPVRQRALGIVAQFLGGRLDVWVAYDSETTRRIEEGRKPGNDWAVGTADLAIFLGRVLAAKKEEATAPDKPTPEPV